MHVPGLAGETMLAFTGRALGLPTGMTPGVAHRVLRVGSGGSYPLRFSFWSKDLRNRRFTTSALAASSIGDLSLFLNP